MNIKSILEKLQKSKVTRNALWLIGGKAAQMCINLLVGIIIARYLGPSNYGLINYGRAYTAFFLSFCTLGINSLLVKEFVEHQGEEGKIIGTALLLKGTASILSAILIMIIVSIVDFGETETILVVALCSIGMVFNIFDTFNYWFQSKLESKVTAVCSLIAFSVTAAYKVWLLATSKSVTYFAFATSVDYICIGSFLFCAYRKYKGEKLRFSWGYGKKLLKISTPFIFPNLMVAVYGQTDKIMLKQMISEAEIGYYSTAVSISTMWCFIISAIIDSMYPTIMESFHRSKEEFDNKNRLLYAIIFYACVIMSVIISILAEPIIKIFFGEAYLPSVVPLRIVTWYTAFSYLGVARNAWIVCNNRQNKLKYVYAAAAISNVVLNLIFIPSMKASGAALASLLAQIITTMVAPFFMPSLRENSVMMLEAVYLKGIIKRPRRTT